MGLQFCWAKVDIETQVDIALELLSSDPDSCINYTKKLLNQSKLNNNLFGIVKSNYVLGYLEHKRGDYGKAIIFYLEGIRYAKEGEYSEVSKDIANLCQAAGNVFKKFANYDLARKYYDEAMTVASLKNDFQQYTYLVLLSAKVLKEEGKYQKATDLLETTFHSFQNIQKKTVADIYNQLGLIYTKQKNKERALLNFDKLINFVESEPTLIDKYSGRAYHNTGNLHYQLESFDDAVSYYRKAIMRKESVKTSKSSLFVTYKDLSESYLKLKKFDSADYYVNMAENYYEHAKKIPKYYELLKFKGNIMKERGDLEGYIKYQDLYASTLENHHEEQRQIEAADKKYNLDLITQRYFALVAEQERNNQIQYYSAVGGSFLVTLIVLIIAFFQYRKYALRRDLEASLRPYIKDAL